MISCKQLVDFCFDYLEGTLPEAEHQRFQRHLSLCGRCVSFFETYQRTPALSRDALATEITEEVRSSVRAFLRTQLEPK